MRKYAFWYRVRAVSGCNVFEHETTNTPQTQQNRRKMALKRINKVSDSNAQMYLHIIISYTFFDRTHTSLENFVPNVPGGWGCNTGLSYLTAAASQILIFLTSNRRVLLNVHIKLYSRITNNGCECIDHNDDRWNF